MFQTKEEERCHTKNDYAQFNKEIETLIMRRPTKITGTNRDPADCNILVTPTHEAERRDSL